MITNDDTDQLYAEALRQIFDEIEGLSTEAVEEKFYQAGKRFFPDDTEPRNLMLQIIHTGVLFDELDLSFPGSNPPETLKRYKAIVSDYLAGRFYKSYFVLRGSYVHKQQGYGWSIRIIDGRYIVQCAKNEVYDKLVEITQAVNVVDNHEFALQNVQQLLPAKIEDILLSNSEIIEYM